MSGEYDVERFLSRNPEIHLTNEQLASCRYLERKGLRFGVDFGYQNAPDMVWSELDGMRDQ